MTVPAGRQRPKLNKVPEAAEQLDMKTSTVRSWVLHRKIKFLKIGRGIRIPQDEIDRILAESVVPREAVQ